MALRVLHLAREASEERELRVCFFLVAETAVRRRALDALASAFGFGTSPPKESAMAVIIRPVGSAAELAAAFDVAGAQFDPAIDHTDERRFAELTKAISAQNDRYADSMPG